jgi:hypothetical protein
MSRRDGVKNRKRGQIEKRTLAAKMLLVGKKWLYA